MGGVISCGALATKIRAMKSRLLKEEDFERLAGRESVTQAVAYLRQLPSYQAVLEGQNDTELSQQELERLAVGTLYYDFSKLYLFCDKGQKKLLEFYFGKFEINVIKRALRRIFNHGDRTGESRELRAFFQKLSRIHMEEMSQAETVPQLLSALRDTGYRKVLAHLESVKEASLFDYEMALDMHYFSKIWKKKDKMLKGRDLAMLTRTFGSQIDLLNLTWIYRAKTYYQLPRASVAALAIPITYRLHEREIGRMIEASNEKELQEVLEHTYYGRHFTEITGGELENLYRQLLNRIYKEESRKNPYSLAVVTAYLHDKEEEIDKLTTVLEGVRYGLEPGESLAYIGQAAG